MEKIKLSELPVAGLPLYEMQKVFNVEGNYSSMSINMITLLPGQRVPAKGHSCHEADEYSVFLEGEVYTESGDFKGDTQTGDATLIPSGEVHWCENRTDEPCKLVCVMLK